MGKKKEKKKSGSPEKNARVGSASGASDINRGEKKKALPKPEKLKKKG